MTKMAATPIYGKKNFENLLFQNRMSYDLETWHVASGTQALQGLYKWWPWVDLDLFYGKVKFGNLGFLWEKVKTVDFSETIAASDLNGSRSRHLIRRYVSIEGQGHFLTWDQGRVHIKIQTGFSQKLLYRSESNFVWKLLCTRKWKSDDMILVTWPRWPPHPYMVKTLQKYSSPEPAGWFSRNLVCSIGDSSPS